EQEFIMFCHDCGFKIKDQDLTECPECSCIISSGLSSGNNPGKEGIFQDIENILNNDELSELRESSGVEEEEIMQLHSGHSVKS
ncbi:unnamed protein product, partial [marine sediment metagenome]